MWLRARAAAPPADHRRFGGRAGRAGLRPRPRPAAPHSTRSACSGGWARRSGWPVYFVLAGRVDAGCRSVAMASGGMAVGAAACSLLGLIGRAAAARPPSATSPSPGSASAGWCRSLGLSLVAAVVAYVAGIAAARILGPRLSSFVGLTEVLFAVLIAWLLLGELPTGCELVGGALIVAGVALVRLDELRGHRGVRAGRRPSRSWPLPVGARARLPGSGWCPAAAVAPVAGGTVAGPMLTTCGVRRRRDPAGPAAGGHRRAGGRPGGDAAADPGGGRGDASRNWSRTGARSSAR